MNVLPIALTPKNVLLIGAGDAAALKAKNILQSDCALVIIAQEIKNPYFADKQVTLKPFGFEFLKERDFDIVIDASGDESLSKQLWESRKRFGYLLNCVDKPQFCDFYFGANFKNHDLSVSVSTGGSSPRYAQYARDLVEAVLPQEPKEFYAELKERRDKGDTSVRVKKSVGDVYLIGCGTGSRDNLSLKALKALKLADVAL
ncbi:MAG: NAD(P)-dependent oxidoreductase, partial [Campylobacteraceae bacterium]|nr:NAD(P)-dependent oxidoreductase [Campylobacteraceae bacterium]